MASFVERAVGDVLSRVLGRYVKDFAGDSSFRASLWDGSVTISKLELRTELVQALSLPVRLSGAYIGEIRIVIPWRSLISKPIEIHVEHVYVLCLARTQEDPIAEYDAAAEAVTHARPASTAGSRRDPT